MAAQPDAGEAFAGISPGSLAAELACFPSAARTAAPTTASAKPVVANWGHG